ncbi:MAG TPA: PAS domain S-box protein [Candidatus Marinimicrobia bacterium]|nr:PAS domain S-box protein [Candidatus Neomarinimicrobiota bacterium]
MSISNFFSEFSLFALLENLPDIVLRFDRDGRIIYANPAVKSVVGYEPDDLIGRGYQALSIDKEIFDLWSKYLGQAFRSKKNVQVALTITDASGESRHFDSHFIAEEDFETDKIISILNVNRDVTELTNARNSAAEAQLVLTSVLDMVPHLICAKDANGNYLMANRAMAEAYKLCATEMAGKNQRELHSDPIQLELMLAQDQQVIQQNETLEIPEDFFTDAWGRERVLHTTKMPFVYHGIPATLIVGVDITEQRKAEKEKQILNAQLRQRRKMESIGTLAGGVAHEINNPLTGIINYSQLLADDNSDEMTRNFAEGIQDMANRIAKIVEHLLTFARQDSEFAELFSIEQVINAALTLFSATLKIDQIIVNIDIASDIPKLMGYPQQIQQVIMNLITNARKSLNLKYQDYNPNKILNIHAQKVTVHDTDFVQIAIEDHGGGIPAKNIKQIFKPFQNRAQGSDSVGMGLSVSQGIIEEHEGTIVCESELGEFARFTVTLPVSKES